MSTQTRARRPRPDQELPPGDDVVGLPTFSHPTDDPLMTDPTPFPFLADDPADLEPTTGPRFVRGEHVGSDSPAAPRTRNSSATEPRDFTALTRGVLRSVAAVAAAILANVGRQLRRPTADDVDAMAAPLARIALRHLPIDKLGDTLLDSAEFGGAVAEYAAAGPLAPLVYPPVVQVGMEHGPVEVPYDRAKPADPPAPLDLDAGSPGVEVPPPPPPGGVSFAE